METEYDNCVVVGISKALTGLAADCILLGMYLPPSQSIYYNETDIYNGISLLEQCLLDTFEVAGDLPVIVCGDLNARTGEKNGRNVQFPDVFDVSHNDFDEGSAHSRISKDVCINDLGRYLLNVCDQFNLLIMNGMLPGDEWGDFTYIAHNGASVIISFCLET